MSVYPSARMERLGLHGTGFHEIWYFSIFKKSVEKIHIPVKPNKNSGYFTWPIYICIMSRSILFRMKNGSDRSYRENKKTFFVQYNHEIYEKMWRKKHCIDTERSQLTIWCMHIACLILRLQTHTLTIRNTYSLATAATVVRTRFNVTCFVHNLPCCRSQSEG